MKTIRGGRDFNGKKVISKIVAIVVGVIGFFLSQPFIWGVLFAVSTVHMTPFKFFASIAFMFGVPMFFGGIFGFFLAGRGAGSASTDQSDMGRIRHAVEMERMQRRNW